MDLPNFDLNAITGFFKKNKMLVLPIGICIIALALLIPTRLVGNSVKKKMKKSVDDSKTLARMLNSDTSYSREQVPLARQQSSIHRNDSRQVISLARQTTQRELINYDIFPEPVSKSQQIYTNYSKNYRSSIEALLDRIGARDAPSELEKENATAHLNKKRNPKAGRGFYGNNRNRPRNQDYSFNAIIDALCEKRAASIPMYANLSVFKWYEFWGDFTYAGEDAAVRDCWNSQVAFWVYEDVVSTIEALNSSSNSVADSPVKRLLGIGFDAIVNSESALGDLRAAGSRRRGRPGGRVRSRSRSSSSGGRDVPEYVLEREGTLVSNNWTGRTGNEDIDVIQFSFSVVLDSASVPVFVKELCSEKKHKFKAGYSKRGKESEYKHNQIGILRYSLEPVEREDPGHADYGYGDRPVAALSLVCEYVFHKDGYDKIMPKMIKDELAPPTAMGAGMEMRR